MIKFRGKIEIIINDFSHLLLSKIGLIKYKKILWGRSPHLEFGPGIRTLRLKKGLQKEFFDKNIIYMQSHWPWYEIMIYSFLAKLLNIKIIFNQNGIYSKNYKQNFKFYNFTLLFGIIISDYIIYQSNFCFKSIYHISNNFVRKFLNNKNYSILLNPTLDTIEKVSNNNNQNYTILICNSFSKDRLYYSKFIYNLVSNFDKNKKIAKTIIAGNFLNNLNKIEKNDIQSKSKIEIIQKASNNEILKLISKCSFIVHLNYGDPCPNFICEAISFGKPSILNDVGGAKEIALNSCVIPKNNMILDGQKMPDITNCLNSIEQMMSGYNFYKESAKIRTRELNINQYVNKHIEIIKNL